MTVDVETQTPIETLRLVVDEFQRNGALEEELDDARDALEDVEALVAALANRSAAWHYAKHVIVQRAPWPLNTVSNHTIPWEICPRSPCVDDRAALAKFTGKP